VDSSEAERAVAVWGDDRGQETGALRPGDRLAWWLLPILLLALPTLTYPPGVDQATFTLVGDGWLDGFLPYADRWDVKPPGIFLLYGLARALMGHTWWAIRVLDVVWTMATCVLLFRLGRRLGPRTGQLAAFGYGLHVMVQPPWELGQTDGMTGLLVVAAASLFASALHAPSGRKQRARATLQTLVAGLLLGGAILLKLPAALFLLVPVGMLALQIGPRGRLDRTHLRLLAALALGVFLPLSGTVLYFAFVGGLQMFLETLFVWAPRLAWGGARAPWSALFSNGVVLGHRNLWSVPLLAGGALVAVVLESIRGNLRKLAIPLLLLGAGLLMTTIQFKFYRYHWMACLPGLALLAGHGLGEAWSAVRGVKEQWQRRVATLSFVVGALAALPLDMARPFAATGWLVARISGRIDEVGYYQRFFQASSAESYNFAEDLVVGRYVRDHAPAGSTLFVWGFEPPIYIESGCAPASRFIYHYPVAARWAPPRWRTTLLSDLQAQDPTYFVVSHKGSAPWMTGRSGNTADLLATVPGLETFLRRGYNLETTIGAFDLYRRRETAPGAGAVETSGSP